MFGLTVFGSALLKIVVVADVIGASPDHQDRSIMIPEIGIVIARIGPS